MSTLKVERAIINVLPIINEKRDISEDDTREKVIDPILRSLGWDPIYGDDNQDEECVAEYYPFQDSELQVDYAMFDGRGEEAVFIEAKKLLEYTPQHYRQLAGYMVGRRDLVGVLTNGEYWNIYYRNSRGQVRNEGYICLTKLETSESASLLVEKLDRSNWH